MISQKQTLKSINFQCPQLNSAQMICSNPNCQNPALICLKNQCKICNQRHTQCQIRRLTFIIDKLNQFYTTSEQQQRLKKTQDALIKIYDEALQYVQSLKKNLHESLLKIKFNSNQKQFLKKSELCKFQQISPKMISEIIQSVNKQRKHYFCYQRVQKQWNRTWKEDFKLVFKQLDNLLQQKLKIDSVLTDQAQFLQDYLGRGVQKFKFLYRASQNQFQIQNFQKSSEYKYGILILAKTNFGKLIGAYSTQTFCRTYIQRDQTVTAENSFLFSMSNKQKLNLIDQNAWNAINQTKRFGPFFGQQDFVIVNKSNQNQNYFRVGSVYNTKQKKYDGNQINDFSGQQNQNEKTYIIQWQAFEVQFIY